jgi:hypothetical protein
MKKTLEEQNWEDKLEAQINQRIAKRELCKLLGTGWNNIFDKYQIQTLQQKLIAGLSLVEKYNLVWRPTYIGVKISQLENYLKRLYEKNQSTTGKITLSQASMEFGILIAKLNNLRINKLVTAEKVGNGYYFYKEALRLELYRKGYIA